MTSKAPKARTRQALWNIKAQRPELFDRTPNAEREQECPPGFETCERTGFLHHPTMKIFWEKATGRISWYDASLGNYRDFREGISLPVGFSGGAAARYGKVDANHTVKPQAPKHVVIPDLHRVAHALKTDLSHLDKPAAMLAVYGEGLGPGGVTVEVAARMVHEKLIRRLAAWKSEWSEEALRGALIGTLQDLLAPAVGSSASPAVTLPAIAVALVIGDRAVVAASPGACFCSRATSEAAGGGGPSASPKLGEFPAASCFTLAEGPFCHPIDVCLAIGDVPSNWCALAAQATCHLASGRPRAASMRMLKAARDQGASGPVAAACMRLAPDSGQLASPGEQPPAKRLKADAAPSKARVRQILLRAWKGAGPQPTEPIRRKQVSRSFEEAEARLLEVLDGLVADNCAGFSAACKAISECQSSLKGGELTGDLGWLDREPAEQTKGSQSNPGAAIKSVVPGNVRKAAFDLEVGELSDVVTSELGVHILLRTA